MYEQKTVHCLLYMSGYMVSRCSEGLGVENVVFLGAKVFRFEKVYYFVIRNIVFNLIHMHGVICMLHCLLKIISYVLVEKVAPHFSKQF